MEKFEYKNLPDHIKGNLRIEYKREWNFLLEVSTIKKTSSYILLALIIEGIGREMTSKDNPTLPKDCVYRDKKVDSKIGSLIEKQMTSYSMMALNRNGMLKGYPS